MQTFGEATKKVNERQILHRKGTFSLSGICLMQAPLKDLYEMDNFALLYMLVQMLSIGSVQSKALSGNRAHKHIRCLL